MVFGFAYEKRMRHKYLAGILIERFQQQEATGCSAIKPLIPIIERGYSKRNPPVFRNLVHNSQSGSELILNCFITEPEKCTLVVIPRRRFVRWIFNTEELSFQLEIETLDIAFFQHLVITR